MSSPEANSAHDEGATLCSQASSARGLPLIGTAGCYDTVLVFELQSPWTPRLVGSRASDARLDAAIATIASQHPSVRLLAVEPAAERDTTTVLWFARAPGPFGGYPRREFALTRNELPELLEQLAGASQAPDVVRALNCEVASDAASSRDILVCTHGARDACCGKFGYPLYLELAQRAATASSKAEQIRVWRSSHLGGHRFAPTLLDLPSGRMFGRMKAGDANAVVTGGAALRARLPEIYRGRCALPESAQIVERQLWLESGDSFEEARLDWQVEPDSEQWLVQLDAHASERGQGTATAARTMHARVLRAAVEAVHTPASCGRDPESEAPWKIVA